MPLPLDGQWNDITIWNPFGYPGLCPGDTATVTVGPTNLFDFGGIANPLAGVTMNCASCTIDSQPGGSFTLAGPGSLSGGAALLLNGGTFRIANGGALTLTGGPGLQINSGLIDVQSGGQLSLATTATIASAGTLQVSGGTVSGAGTIGNSGTIVQAGAPSTISAPIINNPGGTINTVSSALDVTGAVTGTALTKSGSGTLALDAANTYTGGTTVSAGTLLVNNATGSGTGAGDVDVVSGATIGGTGSIAGNLTAEILGSIAPGNAGIGTLTIGGGFTWNGYFTTQPTAFFDLSNVSFASDRLVIAGTFTKGLGSSYTFDFQGTGQPGTYTLATFPARRLSPAISRRRISGRVSAERSRSWAATRCS